MFASGRLSGAVTLGVGPIFGHRLVDRASPEDGLTLTRLYLDDSLPRNSESHVLGIVVRQLRAHTRVRFLLSYADPSALGPGGVPHLGFVYQASGWIYTGQSAGQPLMDLGDGVARHLRSVGSALGTHSAAHLRRAGLAIRMVPQAAKHRYLVFVDRRWRTQLLAPILPYPKEMVPSGGPRSAA